MINLTCSDYLHESVEMLEKRDLALKRGEAHGVKSSLLAHSLSESLTNDGLLPDSKISISFKLNLKTNSSSATSNLPTILVESLLQKSALDVVAGQSNGSSRTGEKILQN